MTLKIGIIGGSGIADAGFFTEIEKIELNTPYGKPSGPYAKGEYEGVEIYFLNRHGPGHTIPPHKVNYRANIWGMKELGVSILLCPSAVGSLKEEYEPAQICITDQLIDFTRGRDLTFFDGPRVMHLSIAEPMCGSMRKLLIDECEKQGLAHHNKGTYITIAGPRFSTRAESHMFRNFADIIGMTLVPECQLARELGICYANIAMITDYDVWKEKPVNMEEVMRTMRENVDKIQSLLAGVIPRLGEAEDCDCAAVAEEAEM